MCRVLVHIYLLTFFDSRGFEKSLFIICVLPEVMKRKTVDSYCFVITVFQNAMIFTFFNVLNTIKVILRACSHDPGTTHCPGATH